jgi:hypothetical protein
MSTIKSPFGASDSQTPAYAATLAVSIENDKTIITPGTLTGNLAMNLTIDSEVGAGAEIIVILTADGTNRTFNPGTGFSSGAPTITIPLSTTVTANYIYSGTEFVEKSEPTGIDSVAVATATTHVTSAGTDHANVGLADTHRTGNGSDHANVALNDTHRTSNGTDHANVGLADTHRTGNGSDHANVATNTTNISNLTNGTTVITGRTQNSATGSVGTVPAGVTAVHYGNGSHITTVLTLANVDLGAIAGAGAAATGALIYTFPAGVHVHEVSYMSVGVVGDLAVQADTPDFGIGSVIASGANALLSDVGATCEDYITGQTLNDVNGTAEVAMTVATAGALTGISLNAAGDVKAVHLNIADTWAAASAALLASGTVVLKWNKIA